MSVQYSTANITKDILLLFKSHRPPSKGTCPTQPPKAADPASHIESCSFLTDSVAIASRMQTCEMTHVGWTNSCSWWLVDPSIHWGSFRQLHSFIHPPHEKRTAQSWRSGECPYSTNPKMDSPPEPSDSQLPRGHGSKSRTPSEHPNPTTKID